MELDQRHVSPRIAVGRAYQQHVSPRIAVGRASPELVHLHVVFIRKVGRGSCQRGRPSAAGAR